jgi:hypothetical protein
MKYVDMNNLCETLCEMFASNNANSNVIFVNSGTEKYSHGMIIQFHNSHIICLNGDRWSKLCREIGVYRNTQPFDVKKNEYSSIVRSGKLAKHLGKPITLVKFIDGGYTTWYGTERECVDVSKDIAERVHGFVNYDVSLTLLLHIYEFYDIMHMIDKKEIDDWNNTDLVFMDEYIMGYITKY